MEAPQEQELEVPEPVMVQVYCRKEKENQTPAYLHNLPVHDDTLGFNPSGEPGVELIGKTFDKAVSLVHVLPEMFEAGLIVTHASLLTRYDYEYSREFRVARLHLFHEGVARVHEGMDQFKLIEAFDEIFAMGFFRVHAHRNPGEHGSWLSLSCDGRTQRYSAEDTSRPIRVRTDGGDGRTPKEERTYALLAPDHELHYTHSGFVLK